MKKLILLSLCCVLGMQNVHSQKSELTPSELRYRNSIEQFLKEEGYFPTIDDGDNSLNFKKEGNKYWLTVKGDGPYYVTLYKGGFTMEGVNRKAMLEACNEANRNKRCGKACVDRNTVVFTVEFYCHSIEEFKNIFYDNMRAVDIVKSATNESYSEHNK